MEKDFKKYWNCYEDIPKCMVWLKDGDGEYLITGFNVKGVICTCKKFDYGLLGFLLWSNDRVEWDECIKQTKEK